MHYQRARNQGVLDEVAPPVTTHCDWCGVELPEGRDWRTRYCSRAHGEQARWEAQRVRDVDNCEWCGKQLPSAKRTHARFCDAECGQKWNNKRRANEARAERVATRPPCPGCGLPLPTEKRTNATYHNAQCKALARRALTYGLSKEELDVLLQQHGVCAICKRSNWGPKGPQVDHDHATGAVREILCTNCNTGLGRFKDNPEALRAAAEYLERHQFNSTWLRNAADYFDQKA
jgi:hypothetical protein